MRKIKIKEKNHNLRIKYRKASGKVLSQLLQHYAQQPHK